MISIPDPEAARKVSIALKEAWSQLDASAVHVREGCTEEERVEYFKHLGDILYLITFKLMEPLYLQHPDLCPENWDHYDSPMDPD